MEVELRDMKDQLKSVFDKEKITITMEDANPSILDDPEEMTLSLKEFNKLKKHMITNTAGYENTVWICTTPSIIHVTSINGESLIDRDIAELQEIIPGIQTEDIEVNFRTIGKWNNK